ncbi:MAG: T9SS type A sorting domain-containing protein [Bacteroidota bacterium]
MVVRSIIIFVFCLLWRPSTAQVLWAGDVNNNGLVNKVDLLYLGYAFGEMGASRVAATTDWEAQSVPTAWEGSFPNGLNFLYADCNGDGTVDELDAAVILENAGLTHEDVELLPDEILVGMEGVDPACRFRNVPPAAPVNQLFELEIGLGEAGFPVENMSGFTFTLDVEPDIIDLNNTVLTVTPDTWIEPDTNQSILVQQLERERAKLKVAYTKTDGVPISGFGSVAKVSFLIEGDLVDFLVVDTITYTIDSIIVFTEDLTPIPIVPDTLRLGIDKDLKVNVLEKSRVDQVAIYPNPNRGIFLLETIDVVAKELELYNEFGQLLARQPLKNATYQKVDLQGVVAGIYFVKIYTDQGLITKKVQKF